MSGRSEIKHTRDNPFSRTYAIILAAGNSSRLGSPKQLLEWRGGNLLQHSLQAAETLFKERVIVVLGASAGQIRQVLQPTSARLVINPSWQDGMSGSIRVGMNALPADAQAVMILLCDQPLIDADSLLELITVWQAQPKMIVASGYADCVGVPAIFPASVFSQLTALRGDRGAKQILSRLKDQVIIHPLQAAALDIDTQLDFELLIAQERNSPGGVL